MAQNSWGDRDAARAGDAFLQRAAALVAVHQEADGAQVHAIGRNDAAGIEHVMQRLEHEAIAAKHDDRVRFLEGHPFAQRAQIAFGFLSAVGRRRAKRESSGFRHWSSIPGFSRCA